jgi:transposase
MSDIKYIGIDAHQATSVIAVMNKNGKVIAEAIIETKGDAVIDFLKSQRGTLAVTFEEGTYADWLYDVIKPHVARVVVCDPRKNKQDGSKTDKIDARKLADRLRTNSLKPVFHGESGVRTLKELARSYVNLQADSTRVKNRIKAIFRARGIPCRGQVVYGAKHRQEWLAKLDNLGARRRAGRLLEELEPLGRLRLEAQKEMVQESRKQRGYKFLRGIPGLGAVRVALILGFVMTPHRFRSKRQFWSYVGLAVVTQGSGEYTIIDQELRRSKKKPLPRGLNKSCNHVLKDVFKGAAVTAAGRGPFKKLYEARLQNGTESSLALLTMARKISSIALSIWKKGELFDIKRHALSEQTT